MRVNNGDPKKNKCSLEREYLIWKENGVITVDRNTWLNDFSNKIVCIHCTWKLNNVYGYCFKLKFILFDKNVDIVTLCYYL